MTSNFVISFSPFVIDKKKIPNVPNVVTRVTHAPAPPPVTTYATNVIPLRSANPNQVNGCGFVSPLNMFR